MIGCMAKMWNTTMHHSVYFKKVQEVTKQLSEAKQKELDIQSKFNNLRSWQRMSKEQKEQVLAIKQEVVLLQRKLHKLKLMQRNGNYYEY